MSSPEKPLLSVVVPFRNRKALLGTAIRSVIETGYPRLEILAVDDGSTDGADGVVRELERQGVPVRLLCHAGGAHKGISATRNRGFVEAAGEFTAFLDSDDAFLPWRFDVAIPLLVRSEALLGVYEPVSAVEDADFDREFRELEAQPDVGWNRPLLPSRGVFEAGRLLCSLLSEEGLWWSMPGIVLRTSVRDSVGLFDPAFPVAEDTNYWLRLAGTGRITCAQDRHPVALVRRHADHSWRGLEGADRDLAFLAAVRDALGRLAADSQAPKPAVWQGRRLFHWHFRDAVHRYASRGDRASTGRLLRWAGGKDPRLLVRQGVIRDVVRLLNPFGSLRRFPLRPDSAQFDGGPEAAGRHGDRDGGGGGTSGL